MTDTTRLRPVKLYQLDVNNSLSNPIYQRRSLYEGLYSQFYHAECYVAVMVTLTLLPFCHGSNVIMTVMVTMLHGNNVTMTAEYSNNVY